MSFDLVLFGGNDGRLLSLLEGGYNLDRLGECVTAHVERLAAPL